MLTQRIRVHGKEGARSAALEVASAAILRGSVISVPTETFYALSADPFNLLAVEQIFMIKGRQDWKPLLLLLSSIEQVDGITRQIPSRFLEIATRFWPGPLTLILPAAKSLPRKVTGGTGTVGVRVPALALTRELIESTGIPLVGTSANRSGHPPCSKPEDVMNQLGGKIELILDQGDTQGSAPSTILDLTREPARLVREGAVPASDLAPYLSS